MSQDLIKRYQQVKELRAWTLSSLPWSPPGPQDRESPWPRGRPWTRDPGDPLTPKLDPEAGPLQMFQRSLREGGGGSSGAALADSYPSPGSQRRASPSGAGTGSTRRRGRAAGRAAPPRSGSRPPSAPAAAPPAASGAPEPTSWPWTGPPPAPLANPEATVREAPFLGESCRARAASYAASALAPENIPDILNTPSVRVCPRGEVASLARLSASRPASVGPPHRLLIPLNLDFPLRTRDVGQPVDSTRLPSAAPWLQRGASAP